MDCVHTPFNDPSIGNESYEDCSVGILTLDEAQQKRIQQQQPIDPTAALDQIMDSCSAVGMEVPLPTMQEVFNHVPKIDPHDVSNRFVDEPPLGMIWPLNRAFPHRVRDLLDPYILNHGNSTFVSKLLIKFLDQVPHQNPFDYLPLATDFSVFDHDYEILPWTASWLEERPDAFGMLLDRLCLSEMDQEFLVELFENGCDYSLDSVFHSIPKYQMTLKELHWWKYFAYHEDDVLPDFNFLRSYE